MADKSGTQSGSTQELERGDIYFLYRPKVEQEDVSGTGDVQRMYMVLNPEGENRYRLITVGRKRLPEVSNGGQRYWGFVGSVAKQSKEIKEELDREVRRTKTRGTQEQPEARPAGEGLYAIVRHDDHTHLMYELELPEKPNDVQDDLNIEPEASYIFIVKNPEQPSPPQAGLSEEQEAEFPKELQQRFGTRKFNSLDPPDFLNYEGTEVVLVAPMMMPRRN